MTRGHKKGVPWSPRQREVLMKALPRGENHPGWKGMNISYEMLHDYLLRNFKKTGICVICKAVKVTEWALKIGHKYSKDISDYDELCRSCHRKRDFGASNRKDFELSKRSKT